MFEVSIILQLINDEWIINAIILINVVNDQSQNFASFSKLQMLFFYGLVHIVTTRCLPSLY